MMISGRAVTSLCSAIVDTQWRHFSVTRRHLCVTDLLIVNLNICEKDCDGA
jgi:hypothetical protein